MSAKLSLQVQELNRRTPGRMFTNDEECPTMASPIAQPTPPQEPRAVLFVVIQAIAAWRTHPVAYLLA